MPQAGTHVGAESQERKGQGAVAPEVLPASAGKVSVDGDQDGVGDLQPNQAYEQDL